MASLGSGGPQDYPRKLKKSSNLNKPKPSPPLLPQAVLSPTEGGIDLLDVQVGQVVHCTRKITEAKTE